jgi:hypothetical protein
MTNDATASRTPAATQIQAKTRIKATLIELGTGELGTRRGARRVARTVGAAWRPIVIDRRHLSGVPFSVKEILQIR